MSNKIKNIKKLILIVILLPVFLIGCNVPTQQQQQSIQSQEQIFHKITEVRVTEIKKTWEAKNLIKWSVTVRSDEYNLEETYEEYIEMLNSSTYGLDIYHGKIKKDSIIKAELLTWKTGDVINRRDLNGLKK